VTHSLAVDSFSVEKTQQSVQTAVDGSSLTARALLHELQLGEQLNQSIRQTRRADFALMLAMLAPDVREQSQFYLPPSAEVKSKHQDNTALRAFFELPEPAPLALRNNDEIRCFNQAELLKEKGLQSLHLTNAMIPKPLAFRDDAKHIPSNIMTNTSLYCQLQHDQIKSDIKDYINDDVKEEQQKNQSHKQSHKQVKAVAPLLNKSLSFNTKEWLKGIEEALVKAPLFA
jgi:hypothetical protein